ncbi:hypothetical protein [Actinoplanes sp. NPDC051859]|uniref:phage terminase small subunit n=1 Tax=Actinoplanes sp. NPDC051859 TaxID=3363909 RepID=UPI0037A5FBC8
MTGSRGPVPKRADQRRRRNQATAVSTVAPRATPVPAPPLGFPAHPIAADWYRSLAESG